MSLRRRRTRGEKPKAQVDMTSLIDLTFLLLVTFIVTLPALEQGVSIMLPQAKTDQLPTKDNKANTVTIDALNRVFLNNKPITLEELESTLMTMSREDPDLPVLVRGDERLEYGQVMNVVKILHKCKIRKMALVTVEK
ncbi:MAG: biopolymer transporter ExbD [Kiritimatiellae bacterium]|jgi:biopolymer transport protein ExbD|nr:biopolymer transporter ExbD [Kiritimatiellia bacterium]